MEAEYHREVAAGVTVVNEADPLEVTLLKPSNRLQRRDVGDWEPAASIQRSQKRLQRNSSRILNEHIKKCLLD